ncbi:hypothetical protein EU534_02635 [Candidatus Heimdallarchaeota archaeon]|nr:MAG: hypothetical protein EU534_02635 [Candidatus Heimdallarchaeota archaeon]
MKTKMYQVTITSGIVVVLLFCNFFASAQVTDEAQGWEDLRDSYTYSWDAEWYNYNLQDPLQKHYEEIVIWEVENTDNEITFRTDKWEVFLGMVDCENETCYDLYRAAWLYDNDTESFKVTYRYNNVSQEIGFVDPISLDFMDQNLEVPMNIVEMHFNFFTFWDGLGFTFLPVTHEDFSFETNYTLYELAYKDFEIEYKDTFRFQRRKFEGYSFEFSYTWEYNIYGYEMLREKIYRRYSYNVQGVLYEFFNEFELSTNKTGEFTTEQEGIFKYYLEEYDRTLIVTYNWICSFGTICIISVIIFVKKKQ